MRPWTELTELVSREEMRLGIELGDGAHSPAPSARLLAIISSLRAIAEHEAKRTQTAEVALAKAEWERDRLRAVLQKNASARSAAARKKAALAVLLQQLVRAMESQQARSAVTAATCGHSVARLVASKAA